ncbi:CU044_2847 family protein [Streptomyces sp. NPDC051976]|uniref:CU044_2847 family protein n=1 Tax=Streptomyces sp. NPDC051976 TaxID=3154947 RepID=UPI0034376EE1
MTIVSGPGGGLDGAAPIYVQIDAPAPGGLGTGTSGGVAGVYDGIDTRANPATRVIEIARDVYADGLDLARRCAEQAATRFDTLADGARPDEIEVQLAIKMDASLGAVLVQTGAEAQLQVTFRWTPGVRA